MYQAMGGLTGFTSLVDGVDKLQLNEERNIRRPPLVHDSTGRLIVQHDTSTTAVPSLLTAGEGDEVKQRELRRGKISELDEMALYDSKYKKSMSVRSRTGLRPVTPQRIDDDSTRYGSGTPRRSSFNTSMNSGSGGGGGGRSGGRVSAGGSLEGSPVASRVVDAATIEYGSTEACCAVAIRSS